MLDARITLILPTMAGGSKNWLGYNCRMSTKALIFDMDGTIVHNMPAHNQAWQDTLAEAGVHIEQDEFHRRTSGQKNQEILRLMLGPNLTEEQISYWTKRKETLYRDRFACCIEPVPGLIELLDRANHLGIPMAVASAAPPENLSFILDGLEVRWYFKAIVGGDDVVNGKPHPDIFLKAAQMIGCAPKDCLVFEDALGGIEAARRADMDVVAVLTTLHRNEVEHIPHVISAVRDYTQVNLDALLAEA